jgi:hypothetical protein
VAAQTAAVAAAAAAADPADPAAAARHAAEWKEILLAEARFQGFDVASLPAAAAQRMEAAARDKAAAAAAPPPAASGFNNQAAIGANQEVRGSRCTRVCVCVRARGARREGALASHS